MKYYTLLFLCILLHQCTFGQDSLCHPRLVEHAVQNMVIELKEEDKLKYILNNPLETTLTYYEFSTRNNYYLNRDSVKSYIYKAYRRGGWRGNWLSIEDMETPLQIYTYHKIHGKDTCFENILKPFIRRKIQKVFADSLNDAINKNADSIEGIYIPKDIENCAVVLDAMLTDSFKKEIKRMSSWAFSTDTRYGLGSSLQRQWKLRGVSRLSTYFKSYDISDPADMSRIILEYYYRHLRKKPITFKQARELLREENKRKWEHRLDDIAEAINRYSTGDTVVFSFKYEYITPKQKHDHEDHDCEALGIVLKKKAKNGTLLIRLISSCDPLGIITEQYYAEEKQIYHVVWKGLMKEGEQRWLHYNDWDRL